MSRTILGLALAMLAGLALVTMAQSTAPATTKVELEELDCMGCAKKIAKEIQKIAGVAEIRADLKTRMLFVVHKPNQAPSPRAIWDAIEGTDHKVIKMETPSATFTSKPKA